MLFCENNERLIAAANFCKCSILYLWLGFECASFICMEGFAQLQVVMLVYRVLATTNRLNKKVLYGWSSKGAKEWINFSVKFSQRPHRKEVAMQINRLLSLRVKDWHQLVLAKCCDYIETIPLICSADQWAGIYIIATLGWNGLNLYRNGVTRHSIWLSTQLKTTYHLPTHTIIML